VLLRAGRLDLGPAHLALPLASSELHPVQSSDGLGHEDDLPRLGDDDVGPVVEEHHAEASFCQLLHRDEVGRQLGVVGHILERQLGASTRVDAGVAHVEGQLHSALLRHRQDLAVRHAQLHGPLQGLEAAHSCLVVGHVLCGSRVQVPRAAESAAVLASRQRRARLVRGLHLLHGADEFVLVVAAAHPADEVAVLVLVATIVAAVAAASGSARAASGPALRTRGGRGAADRCRCRGCAVYFDIVFRCAPASDTGSTCAGCSSRSGSRTLGGIFLSPASVAAHVIVAAHFVCVVVFNFLFPLVVLQVRDELVELFGGAIHTLSNGRVTNGFFLLSGFRLLLGLG